MLAKIDISGIKAKKRDFFITILTKKKEISRRQI